jgi:phenylpropionate dioxygenase-like ring-hydroxylating dioxygenase large terminal subunit
MRPLPARTAGALEGSCKPRLAFINVACHAQTVVENVIDYGHVSTMHGVPITVLSEPELDGVGFSALLSRGVLWSECRDIGPDNPVWNYLRHEPQPRLAKGDGPIGPFRRWASKFYPRPGGMPHTPAVSAAGAAER